MDFKKPEKGKHLGLRIDNELHYKLHYISNYYGRSANGEAPGPAGPGAFASCSGI